MIAHLKVFAGHLSLLQWEFHKLNFDLILYQLNYIFSEAE